MRSSIDPNGVDSDLVPSTNSFEEKDWMVRPRGT